MKITKIIKPSLVLFIICLGVTALLAFTSELTKDKINKRAEQEITETRRKVMPGAVSFEDVDEKENVVCGIDSGGGITGYVFSVSVNGYGGEMQVIVGINNSGKVCGVSLLSHAETPGMGAKVADNKFLQQFDGLSEKAKVGAEIDKITGATISSKAVTKAVNTALEEYKAIEGGVK